eukprot:357433-Chlamydomonas_euryale.AAC.8
MGEGPVGACCMDSGPMKAGPVNFGPMKSGNDCLFIVWPLGKDASVGKNASQLGSACQPDGAGTA